MTETAKTFETMKTVPLPRICLFLLCIIWSCGKDTCCDDPPTLKHSLHPVHRSLRICLKAREIRWPLTFHFLQQKAGIYFPKRYYDYDSSDCLITPEGDPLEGEVTLKFIELYDIGDMLFTAKPSIARVSANLRT